MKHFESIFRKSETDKTAKNESGLKKLKQKKQNTDMFFEVSQEKLNRKNCEK